MAPDEEQAYLMGQQSVWLRLLEEALLRIDTPQPLARLRAERAATIALLRRLCRDYGDNTWPDDLYLPDILDNHIRWDAMKNDAEGAADGA
jgi:hypothetical protein